MNAVLFGGPFDGESRNIKAGPDGRPIEEVILLDPVSTMDVIMGTEIGEPIPITYQSYKRASEPSEAGIWRYEFAGTCLGRLAIGDSGQGSGRATG